MPKQSFCGCRNIVAVYGSLMKFVTAARVRGGLPHLHGPTRTVLPLRRNWSSARVIDPGWHTPQSAAEYFNVF
ncbi:hypothetical protein BIW11_08145 [Tropilaelaps mercedesae]|uniref:Uncharacterized protein n=1 Tax=Tropilaelaps mercedesae TaxID=418985 RepID=A0A1V9XQV4_9ACAR|nr:hypothetical protein BIW11_08145 [Tropilaelaps mercedesae]